jgi:hypothetical protein
MKLQGLATMIINAILSSQCTTSISMVASHQRIGKRILDHLRKKRTMQTSTSGLLTIVSEAAHRAKAVVMAEAHTHSGPHTACFTTVKPTTTKKIAPYFLSLKERRSKTPNNLCINHHPEKST